MIFSWDDSALWFLLQSQDGATGRDLARRATRVESAAKGLCPVDTGRLRASIRWTLLPGPVAQVGTDVEYGGYVHDGTRYMPGRPFLSNALSAGA